MDARQLYEEIKNALHYFDLSFREMSLMTVTIDGNNIVFQYRGRKIEIPIGE